MNKKTLKSIYEKVRHSRSDEVNKYNPNRYAKIHVMFHELALLRLKPTKERKSDWHESLRESYNEATRSKQFWKDMFEVESLKDLTNERLKEIEDFLEKRIDYEFKNKFKVRKKAFQT